MEQYIEGLRVYTEALSTFDSWISPVRQNKANAVYADLAKTQEGQLKILDDAKSGNTTAADFLFTLYKRIIAKVFWKYFLGPDKKYHQARIISGDDNDFASVAYSMLLGDSEEASPYETFKPSKFSASADLLKQFGYYFYRYLQNEAVKMIRARNLGGMTGNISHTVGRKKDISLKSPDNIAISSYEDHFENDKLLSSSDNYTSEIDSKITWEAFLRKLRKNNPKYYNIIRLRLNGLDISQVADELGISDQSVRNYLKDIKRQYDAFIGV